MIEIIIFKFNFLLFLWTFRFSGLHEKISSVFPLWREKINNFECPTNMAIFVYYYAL